MSPKLIAFLAGIALVGAGVAPPYGRLAAEPAQPEPEGHASYSFSYDVNDPETGDVKSQSESRDGDVVQGRYSLQDADGYQRIVEYSVNGESGFNAVVRREPLAGVGPVPASDPVDGLRSPVAPPAVAAPKILPAPIVQQHQHQQQHQSIILKTFPQPPTYIRTTYAAPTVVHHAPAHTLIHAQPAVHLTPATHYVHAATASATLLKTAQPAVYTQHHAPAAATHTLVKTHFSAPHVQYVY